MNNDVVSVDRDTLEGWVVLDRRQQAFRLRERGMTLKAIGRELGVSDAQVLRDLRWIETRGASFLAGKAAELFSEVWARYGVLYREAFDAWLRSQEDTVTTTTKSSDGESGARAESSEQRKTSAGDPRFLTVAEACLAKQALLAGLVQDAKEGRATVREVDRAAGGDDDTIAIVEVSSRPEAAALEGKKYCRIAGPVDQGE